MFVVRFPERAVSVLQSGCLETLLLRSLYTDREFWDSGGGADGLRPLIRSVEHRGKILLQHIRDKKLQIKRDLWPAATEQTYAVLTASPETKHRPLQCSLCTSTPLYWHGLQQLWLVHIPISFNAPCEININLRIYWLKMSANVPLCMIPCHRIRKTAKFHKYWSGHYQVHDISAEQYSHSSAWMEMLTIAWLHL